MHVNASYPWVPNYQKPIRKSATLDVTAVLDLSLPMLSTSNYQDSITFLFYTLTIVLALMIQILHWRRSCVFILNFEDISYLVLMFLLLSLSR